MENLSQAGKARRSRREWQRLVDQCEEAGLSATAFCEQHTLPYHSFVKWRSVFKAEGQPAGSPEVPFLDITPSVPSGIPPSGSDAWDIELALGPHIVLRLRHVA